MMKVLQEKYLIPEPEAQELCNFIEPMLNPYPEKRATAAEMVANPWLKDIIIQGEEEVEQMAQSQEIEAEVEEQIKIQAEDAMKPALAINKSGPKRKKSSLTGTTMGTPPTPFGKGKPALPVPTSDSVGPNATDSAITISDAKGSSITIAGQPVA
jgi:serine/threonine protein kinase